MFGINGPTGEAETAGTGVTMNDPKPPKRGPIEPMPRSPLPVSNGAKTTAESEPISATIEQLPVKPAPAMQQNEVPIRKTRGRLSRNTLETLGKVLDVFYDDVRKE